jgi:hypothetical protein
MIKIESLGSYWFIDVAKQTYARTPKRESPRDNPGHTNRGTQMEDLKTFPFTRFQFIEVDPDNYWSKTYFLPVVAVLRLHYRGTVRDTPLGRGSWVHAPLTEDQYKLAKELMHG